ncbi:MAG: hypothetical protein Q8K61_08740 [Gallionella sp.]|nr:hypothetical protein [Gallionella sp.]
MANGHTNLQATDANGGRLSVQHTSTDSPILPAANLRDLQQINPELVTWVVKETEVEATHRRAETTRVNRYVFIERMSGVILGALVAIVGFLIAAYLVLKNHDVAGVAIGGATLGTIVSVLVSHNKKAASEAAKNAPAARRIRKK